MFHDAIKAQPPLVLFIGFNEPLAKLLILGFKGGGVVGIVHVFKRKNFPPPRPEDPSGWPES